MFGLRKRSVIAWSSMLLIGILWGATLPLSQIAVSTGHKPFGLILWQVVLGVIALGVVLLARGWRPHLTRQKLIFYLAIAFMGTIIPNGFSYLSFAHLPAGVMSIIIATVPMFALVIAVAARLERFSFYRFVGFLIGFSAMVLIAAPETSLPDPEKAIFVLLALIAPFFYGVESNYIAAKTPEGTDPVSTLFMASFLAIFLVGPAAIASGQWIDPFDPWGAPEIAVAASSLIHAITYVGYIWLIGYGGPVFGVQVAYPVTLSGVFLSVVFLGEGYSAWIWLALVLVIFGLVLVQPKIDTTQTEETHA
ncbi:MAG: DMT family transporter [Rhizobiaceae bacterium]|nr:DMT family transporter [Rhizobiaceae bacterium]